MISFGFRILLVLATCILVWYCIERYLQNSNTASIDYRRYHQRPEDIYPSVSICFSGLAIYDSDRLQQTYGINSSFEYSMFLKGERWKDEMAKVDYHHITDHLKDYFNGVYISFDAVGRELVYQWINNDDRNTNIHKKNDGHLESFPFVRSKGTASNACFTFDFSTRNMPKIARQIIRMFKVSFNVTQRKDFSLSFGMHYPGQITGVIPLDQEMDKNRRTFNGQIDARLLKIGVAEVLRRREDSKRPCNPESQRTDDNLHQKMAEKIGCKPFHWVNVNHPTICNNSDSMKKANFGDNVFINDRPTIQRPCDELQDVGLHVDTFPRGTFDNETAFKVETNSADLIVVFASAVYREIKHIRGYNFEGMIGNGGGYVGLFLGFAIWQIPDFIIMIFDIFKKNLIKYKQYLT